MARVNVYIEIEQFSNIKYEYDKIQKKLVIDRILDDPYVYPYAYGYIPNTLADDNDELDILIISDISNKSNIIIKNDTYYDVYIIGCLVMEDEKGMDEKILCVSEQDYNNIKDISDINDEIKNIIFNFFSNYKNNSIEKWSKVVGFINKELSIELYKKSIIIKS
jgi:inorganic pyrophosphatase